MSLPPAPAPHCSSHLYLQPNTYPPTYCLAWEVCTAPGTSQSRSAGSLQYLALPNPSLESLGSTWHPLNLALAGSVQHLESPRSLPGSPQCLPQLHLPL